MAKTKSKPKTKRKTPVERVRAVQIISVVFPVRNCGGQEALAKAVYEGGTIKFYESNKYGDGGFSNESIGQGVRLDVLEAVVAKLKES